MYVENGGRRHPYIDEELHRRPDASAWLRDKAMHIGSIAESLLAIREIRFIIRWGWLAGN